MNSIATPQPPKKKVKCPHCGTILVEGDDTCCQALKDELNTLAQANGATLEQLGNAFSKWFAAHEVKDAGTV